MGDYSPQRKKPFLSILNLSKFLDLAKNCLHNIDHWTRCKSSNFDLNDLSDAEREIKRLVSIFGRVELSTIEQTSRVVHAQLVTWGIKFSLVKQCRLTYSFRHLTKEHLLKGKYHSMTDLLFILFGLSCFAYVEWSTALLVCSNPNQSNRRSAILWGILPPMASVLWRYIVSL